MVWARVACREGCDVGDQERRDLWELARVLRALQDQVGVLEDEVGNLRLGIHALQRDMQQVVSELDFDKYDGEAYSGL